MKFIEMEKKLLISRQEYDQILAMLDGQKVINTEQINYYYDTHDEEFRRRNITCRIRQKDEKLTGTVKEHICNGVSVEKPFKVKELPNKIVVEGKSLLFKGQMITFRRVFQMCNTIELALDKNIYLGTIDYELELEYENCEEREAELYMKNLTSIITQNEKERTINSKSESFFERLNCIERSDTV